MRSRTPSRKETRASWRRVRGAKRKIFRLRTLVGALVLAVLVWQGEQLVRWLPEVESIARGLGPWGPVALSAAILVTVPLLVPDSIFGVTAGVAFGLAQGTLYYFGATYLVNLLIYAASRRWLRARVLRSIEKRPRLDAIVRASRAQSLRLTFLIRVIPLNSAAVSYALGAGGVPFRPFAIGTLGLFPHMLLTVYLGYAAARVTTLSRSSSSGWTLETVMMSLGLIACLVLVLQVGRIARSALEELEAPDGDSD